MERLTTPPKYLLSPLGSTVLPSGFTAELIES